MLMLSRCHGQQIRLGDRIVVTVISSRGDKVRLGIDAPPEIPVDRAEVAARKRAERDGSPDS